MGPSASLIKPTIQPKQPFKMRCPLSDDLAVRTHGAASACGASSADRAGAGVVPALLIAGGGV